MHMRRLALVGITLVALAIVAAFFYLINTPADEPVSIASTTEVFHCDNDAKLCPDGSTVLRAGPQCEFAACPSLYGEADEWRTAANEEPEFSFQYPITFGTTYVSPQAWPPVFFAKNTSDCVVSDTAEAFATSTQEELFNGVSYCIESQNEGAAGSLYTAYEIAFPNGDSRVAMYFSLKRVQCANYEGSEQSACEAAQNSFNVIELVDAIRLTITR